MNSIGVMDGCVRSEREGRKSPGGGWCEERRELIVRRGEGERGKGIRIRDKDLLGWEGMGWAGLSGGEEGG